MLKDPRIYSGEKTASSTNGVGKTEQPHANECISNTILHYTQKSTQSELKTWT